MESEDELPTIERGLIRVSGNRFNYCNYAFTWIDVFFINSSNGTAEKAQTLELH